MPFFDRDKLYQQVWEQPITAVAKIYAVSNVRLHKVCRQLKIPTPQAGHWAKKAAGKPLAKQPPLPSYDGAAIFYQDPAYKAQRKALTAPTPEPEELAQFRQREERPSARVEVSQRLVRPLPIVAETQQHLMNRSYPHKDTRGFLYSRGGKWLDLSVSEQTLGRALRIYDALLKALKSRGISLDEKGPNEYRDTHVVALEERVSLALKERSTRSDFTPTEEELKEAKRRGYSYFPKWRYTGTGELRFEIGSSINIISDSGSAKLECRLNDVIVAIFAQALKLKEQERQRQEEEKRRQARAQEIYRQKQLVEAEKNRLSALEQEADRWHRAQRLRSYLYALQAEVTNGTLDMTPELLGKISWGYQKANWLDPLINAEDPVLDMKIHPW